jgi:hypothetical protein
MRAEKKILLRIDDKLFDAIHKWADDELRSMNGQIEFLLREAAIKAGRLKPLSDQGNKNKSEK